MRIDIRDDRPPVPDERVAEAEAALAELGHRIPPSYRAFLAEQDGGKPVRNLFSFRQGDRDQSDYVRLFYGIAESPNGDLVSETTALSHSLPEGLLPIAADSFGNQVVLDGREGADGPVYFWDHELQTEPPDDSGLSWVAPDLETFLDSLAEDPDTDQPEPEKPSGWRRLFGRG
jgi:hypothetical protein